MAEHKETAVVRDTLPHSGDASSGSDIEKSGDDHVEQIHTNERVSSHAQYYEKNGLRTYGDGIDHDHEPPVSTMFQTYGQGH